MSRDVASFFASLPNLPLLPLVNDDAGIGVLLAAFNVTMLHLDSIYPFGLQRCVSRAFVVHYAADREYLSNLHHNASRSKALCPKRRDVK